ncbi:hypothetical protein KPH14_002019 [Odynerus spinipes]|uniref:Fatty acid desaturase domain-containing protein n=1 Tax=Odynerus spinipes TaxID=1348599 RepID=A0AAD9S0B7_9HYME|nr:hypothetical protein KPH14_002019 [Odynerus spinipes]
MDTEKTETTTDEGKNKNNEGPELDEILNRSKFDTDFNYTHSYFWPLVIGHAVMQISWVIGIYTAIFYAQWKTILWAIFVAFLGTESVALGAHRGFTHKSFKMKRPMKIALIFLHTLSGQNSVFTWVRDHKLHHKYADSDADPHNSRRGFFFSHMGWLMVKRNPLLRRMQKEIDISDLKSEPLIMFQHKYFIPLYFVMGFLIPLTVPMYFWNETFWSALFAAYFFPYVTSLHMTWTINSFAHMWGNRPYDGRLHARNSKISWVATVGDGWHNYHHAFPWDCRMAEFGQYDGISNAILSVLEYVGLVYDIKTASPNVLYGHMKRHGDGTGGKSADNSRLYDKHITENMFRLD